MKMYDGSKVVLGLLIFFVVMAFPFIHAASNTFGIFAEGHPDESTAENGLARVASTDSIQGECAVAVDVSHARGEETPESYEERRLIARTEHMELLDDWRDEVVREGKRLRLGMHAGDARATKSLSNTCLDCHTNQAEFCDRCHDNAGVAPYCWDCHVDPASVAGR